MAFTMKDILPILDEVFTPQTNEFSEYVKWTSDCNGDFYRTCYHKKDTPIRNHYDGWQTATHIVIAFSESTPYSRDKLGYELEHNIEATKLKMQLCPLPEEHIRECIEWNKSMDYPTYKVINLLERKDVTDNFK